MMAPVDGAAQTKRKKDSKIPSAGLETKMSLIHVGSNDSFNPTSEGIEAGRCLLEALETNDLKKAKKAIAIYDSIIPRENYGGEYTAMQWFSQYLVSSKSERAALISDPFIANFFHFFADNDFANLKEYLKRKYNLGNVEDKEMRSGQERLALLEDTILFNNPRRNQWEQTSLILEALKLKKGSVIADIGSGPGYFTYRFSHLVGDRGRVFAVDTVRKHLEYVEHFREKFRMPNITTIHTDGKTIGLAGKKVDAVFLCSLYHNIYGMATLEARETFLQSIKRALKADGLLYLVDNGLVEPGTLPYHGPYIAKELIIAQLNHYGFDLVKQYQPVAQRYMLVFKLKKEDDVARTAPVNADMQLSSFALASGNIFQILF
jgi:ubiquinone/menaquinone biosynthesis C-methylase UbiE